MLYRPIYKAIWCGVFILSLAACTQDTLPGVPEEDTKAESDFIYVGVETDDLTISSSITRAATPERKDAELVPWLVQPLKQGLDITYGKVASTNAEKQERVAILKLLPEDGGSVSDANYKTEPASGYAVYTFYYRGDNGSETSELACWHGNGPHYFEGVHVPNRLRYKENASELGTDNREVWNASGLKAVTNLTSNQSDDRDTGTDNDLGNYTLLSHYLGMPANTQISATVSRIKLPFRHRLARVLAYILIDPNLKNTTSTGSVDAKVKGYTNIETDHEKPFKDDPNTTSIKFCNVEVLQGVHDVYNETTKLHTLTPKWYKDRKATPHFCEQLTDFVTYENSTGTVYPGNSNYESVKANHTGYTEKKYKVVPVYDLIIRPTYTSVDNVMYDEDLTGTTKQQIANLKNNIDFVITLDNGLTYQKSCEIDLNANYQTIVYLKITPEGVDYNESGQEIWKETQSYDDWYGLDNTNGNTLSESGSSWQRAFYNNATQLPDDKVTDGGFYDENTSGDDGIIGQYVSTETWKKYLLKAFQGGEHHGDYFVLDQDITIDASELPSDGLVFTGHLDGFSTQSGNAYHTITLTNPGAIVACTNEPLTKLYQNHGATETVPQLYGLKEIAQSRPQTKAGIIEPFSPSEETLVKFNMEETYPADLDGFVIYSKDAEENFQIYPYRTFYKKSPAYLFAGLDGIYSTKQEDEQTAGKDIYNQGWAWEANVHLENGYWLPYRDVKGSNPTNTGWRAEVINLKVIGGSLFKEDCVVTGNVQNCTDANGAVVSRTPAYPKYK